MEDFLLNHLARVLWALTAVASLIPDESFIGTDPSRGPERSRNRAPAFTCSFQGAGVQKDVSGVSGGKWGRWEPSCCSYAIKFWLNRIMISHQSSDLMMLGFLVFLELSKPFRVYFPFFLGRIFIFVKRSQWTGQKPPLSFLIVWERNVLLSCPLGSRTSTGMRSVQT